MPSRLEPPKDLSPAAGAMQSALASVGRLRVLRFVASNPGVTGAQVVSGTGISPAHRVLRELEDLGLVIATLAPPRKFITFGYRLDEDNVRMGIAELGAWLMSPGDDRNGSREAFRS